MRRDAAARRETEEHSAAELRAQAEYDAAAGRAETASPTDSRQPPEPVPLGAAPGKARGGMTRELRRTLAVSPPAEPAAVSELPAARIRARAQPLPSELVIGVLVFLLAITAAVLILLDVFRVSVTG
jgi:hypothetical protein